MTNYDKLYKIRPLLNKLKEKFNEISQEEYQSCDEQMISFKVKSSIFLKSRTSGSLKCFLELGCLAL